MFHGGDGERIWARVGRLDDHSDEPREGGGREGEARRGHVRRSSRNVRSGTELNGLYEIKQSENA